MRKNHKNLFIHLKSVEPPLGLFDKIILAVKKEQGLRQTKNLAFTFLFFLVVSLITTPFSWAMLVSQIESSGIYYLLSVAVSDFGVFLVFWQDFSLAILESLPIASIIAFAVSFGISLFTLRLFLYRKRILLGYLTHSFTLKNNY